MENNKNRTCPNFYVIFKLKDFDIDILIDEKSHENILIYDISYKTLIDPKPLSIRLDKIDGLIRIYNGTTITHKIFEMNSSFHAKQCTTGKV